MPTLPVKDFFSQTILVVDNLAMGVDWPGPVDDKVLPQQFIVDYVRVYQKKKY